MKNILLHCLPVWLLAIIFSGCYPDYNSSTEDFDLAITHYNAEQDFSELNTFYLYDTVVHIVDNSDAIVNRTYDEHIIDQLRQNLIDCGWTEITDTTSMRGNVDAIVFSTVFSTDVYSYYYSWYDYWYWYPWDWFYYPYKSTAYYNYYPYYSGYSVYEYSVGTVFCEIINVKNLVAEEPQEDKIDIKIPIVWSGGLNGIISGSEGSMEARITEQMKQLFDQSPYLKKEL